MDRETEQIIAETIKKCYNGTPLADKIDKQEKLLISMDKSLSILAEHVQSNTEKIKENKKCVDDLNEKLSERGEIGKKVYWMQGKVWLALGALAGWEALSGLIIFLAFVSNYIK